MMLIKKILFLLAIFFYSILHGRARKIPQTINKVLIVQMAKLGDMVCTTPMFSAVKEKYPNTIVYILGNSLNKEVVAYNNEVDKYIVFTSIKDVISKLRAEKFDAAFLAGGPDLTSVAVSFLSGIPLVVTPKIIGGYSPLYDHLYRMISFFVVTATHSIGKYVPREYLRLLEPIGIFSDNTLKKLAYSAKARKEVEDFLGSNLTKSSNIIIGISPSAGNKIKNWGGKKFAELATLLWKKYSANIIIIGGVRDREEVKEMLKFVPSDVPVIDASEKFSIDGLKALISKMNLFVSVDTGPIYIAEAFGVPTVDIVGPMDEREQPPIGPKNLVVVPLGRRTPALHIMNAHGYDKNEARKQTDSITVEMVFDACKNLIN